MDGHRHSVDIPISKALVALRRVRSLRDPSTNSMSRHCFVDNLNWDTSSFTGISLGMEDGVMIEGVGDEVERFMLANQSRKPDSEFENVSTVCRRKQGLRLSAHEIVSGKKTMSERYCNGFLDGGLDSASLTPKRLSQHEKHNRMSKEAVRDIMSFTGSPCLSGNNVSLLGNDDNRQNGCGISCCWSATPTLRESSVNSDVEGQPLLSGELGNTWKHVKGDISSAHMESPCNLSNKFRPKTFKDLVGQTAVIRSLISSIASSKIISFYLFHGPRGTGKTCTSKIFAAALNCLASMEDRPCGECRECVMISSGRGSDVNNIDSTRVNRGDKVRSLMKLAAIPPVSSRFKVFIIDECHLLKEETWAIILNNLDSISRHVVFVMITPYLEKLPRVAISRSQRYHFPKIKEADITSRLRQICTEEELLFEQVALDFIAMKSNGSLRDAEMMLEQLSLLGKRITLTLVYDLIGVVSDDELVDLLDLALSSDTSKTVRKARELMSSRISPMQLVTQLANLIMDILAGKCYEGISEARRRFCSRYTSETSLQQLNHALKILSDAEKQLSASKNQMTWLTAALLQLSSIGSCLDVNGSTLCLTTVNARESDCSTSSTSESMKYLIASGHKKPESQNSAKHEGVELQPIWNKTIEICESSSLRKLLKRHGKLSSIYFVQGLAVVELAFHHSRYASKGEKSWKLIATALQSVLGSNVEIRIQILHSNSVTQYTKFKMPSFSFFSCSRRHREPTNSRHDLSDHSDSTFDRAITRDKSVDVLSSKCASQISSGFCRREVTACTIRDFRGNALSVQTPSRISTDHITVNGQSGLASCSCQYLTPEVPDKHPGCLYSALKLPKKEELSITPHICMSSQPQNHIPLSIMKEFSETHICGDRRHYSCKDTDRKTREDSEMNCWTNSSSHLGKVKDQGQRSFVGLILPCTAAK
ncbi:protein STICHEL-like 2 isoform X2 [Impatiens glandulifera]|uniref:protein STICHEL-like 2 isoform X2 n=1 Tax=Impatiens glandulifera TaxID=253017 RepID=UPI001FB0B63B|nr:protein STICHEL-like 2 isoform X2 [Impatiens glandulifera]